MQIFLYKKQEAFTILTEVALPFVSTFLLLLII